MCRMKGCFVKGLLLFSVLILMGWGEQVQAQEKYPTRAITLVSGFAAGGSTDTVGRLLGNHLNKKWGVPMNVVNKPGGNTIPAQLEVYKSPADGYTLFTESQASAGLVAAENLPFNIADRTYVALAVLSPTFITVPSNSPYKNLGDLIADARKNPGDLSWGSLGGFGGNDIITRQIFKVIGVDVNKTMPVMGKGGRDTAIMAAGGHIKFTTGSIPSCSSLIDGGSLRALAIVTGSKERVPGYPQVPTVAELGWPAINMVFWIGIIGPPKMPSYIVNKWNEGMREIEKDPEYLKQVEKAGLVVHHLDAKEFRDFAAKEMKEIAELYGIKMK